MKIYFILLIFFSIGTTAQTDTIIKFEKEFEIIKNMPSSIELKEDEIKKNHTLTMPKFPGGQIALRKFIAYNVNYPKEARNYGIQGTVYLRFQVKNDGSIGKIEIQKGVHELLDVEAINVIKKLPKFIPDEENGRKVNVWYSIPVTFRLN